MADTDLKRPEMELEDLHRVTRLSEEVRGRLREIALIAARAAGVESPVGPVVKFVPREAGTQADTPTNSNAGAGDWVEIIVVDGFEACYGVKHGKPFSTSPC